MRGTIETERLILRPLVLADAVRYSEFASDWDIARMTGTLPYPIPVISAEIKIEMLLSKHRRGLAYPYAMTLDGKDIIGVMDIFKSKDDDEFELGYWLANPHGGKGLIPEAAKAVMDEAEQSMGVTTFVAGVFADNPASMRVLEKLGFKKTGSEGPYFSMARLTHMESITFERRVSSSSANCLQKPAAMLIEAG